MHNLFDFVADWWLVAIVLILACCGLGALATNLADDFRTWLWGKRPKPRRYRVTIEDSEGWPLRSYRLSANAAGRLVQDLDRNQPDESA